MSAVTNKWTMRRWDDENDHGRRKRKEIRATKQSGETKVHTAHCVRRRKINEKSLRIPEGSQRHWHAAWTATWSLGTENRFSLEASVWTRCCTMQMQSGKRRKEPAVCLFIRVPHFLGRHSFFHVPYASFFLVLFSSFYSTADMLR